MNKYIIDNAKWLKRYSNQVELQKLNRLSFIKRLQQKESPLLIADVGCGNGRSIRTVRTLLPNSNIVAIDTISENIEYINRYENSSGITTIVQDATIFFESHRVRKFDLVLFSWSFFDMIKEENIIAKRCGFENLLDNVKANLNDDGFIMVLQPTKGGSFEKLLSAFIPSSDDDYQFAHEFLLAHGFSGPRDTCPKRSEKLAIWSEFSYQNEQDLFDGIASILFLETGTYLSYEDFAIRLLEFKRKNNLHNNTPLLLTDCVNIYYTKR